MYLSRSISVTHLHEAIWVTPSTPSLAISCCCCCCRCVKYSQHYTVVPGAFCVCCSITTSSSRRTGRQDQQCSSTMTQHEGTKLLHVWRETVYTSWGNQPTHPPPTGLSLPPPPPPPLLQQQQQPASSHVVARSHCCNGCWSGQW